MSSNSEDSKKWIFFLLFFSGDRVSLLLPRLGCNGTISAHHNLRLLGSGNSPASAFWGAGITVAYHHAQLIFAFLVETGFHHIGQAGLEFLTAGDVPTWASQSAGITGVSHCAQPNFCILGISACCPGCSPTPELKQSTCSCLPKCWSYRCDPPHLAKKF